MADKLKLTVHTADKVSRTASPAATGPLANPKFLSALFSADSVDKKRNTEAMEVGPSQLASGRVIEHSAAHARPYDEVKADVRAAFMAARGAEMAREEGQARLKAWTAQPASATTLPAAVTLSRDEQHGQPAALVEAVLRADPAKLPTFVGVDLGTDGYAVAQVEKVASPAAQTAEAAAESRTRYEQLWGVAEARSYYESLKSRYKAQILVPAPAMTTAATSAAAASR